MGILILSRNKIQILNLNLIAIAYFTLTCSWTIILTTKLVKVKKSALNITIPKPNIIDSFHEEKTFPWRKNIKEELEKGKIHDFIILKHTSPFSENNRCPLFMNIFTFASKWHSLITTIIFMIFFHTVFQIIYFKTVSSG